jgi:S1-C subfamily serine protease
MAEGFFSPSILHIPALTEDDLCASIVRVLPKTMLALDIVSTSEEASALARNEAGADGSEVWYRYFTRDELAKVNDPVFAMGMVRHEFARLVRNGAAFPALTPLDGGGTGFAINPSGHVLTNYHLVTGEVENRGRQAGLLHRETPCRGLQAQIAVKSADGHWTWTDAAEVYLVSNPPADRAIVSDERGRAELREDIALLRVVPAPTAHLRLTAAQPATGDPVWMAGFPLRSARSPAALAAAGYADADGSLRVSSGVVTATEGGDYFTTDLDGSMGNSGSPVFNARGTVIGMFSRVTGDGPRNAFEYGHTPRIHVTSSMIFRALELGVETALTS